MDGAAGYNVKRSSVSGEPYATIGATTGLTETRYTDTNVANFTSYYYVSFNLFAWPRSPRQNHCHRLAFFLRFRRA